MQRHKAVLPGVFRLARAPEERNQDEDEDADDDVALEEVPLSVVDVVGTQRLVFKSPTFQTKNNIMRRNNGMRMRFAEEEAPFFIFGNKQ